MAFPIVTIYYGLAIILSILFYNYADEQKFIAGKDQLLQTIGAEKEVLETYTEKVKVAAWPYVEEYYSKAKNFIHPAVGAIEETADQSALFANEKITHFASEIQNTGLYDVVHKITETSAYQKIAYFLTKIYNDVAKHFSSNPQYVTFAQNFYATVHTYADIVYDFFAEKMALVASHEPFKTYISEYIKLHDQFVTPYVEKASEIVSGYLSLAIGFVKEQTQSETEAKYTFLVVVIGVFFAKYALTSVLRLFAKDAFQMSKSMSEMYKQQQKQQALEILKNNDRHSDVYIEIKEKVLDDFALTKDEVEELEREIDAPIAGSNRTRTNSPGSNRTRTSFTGSNRSYQEQQQEEQQEDEGEEEELVMVEDLSSPASPNSHLLSDMVDADADASSAHTTPSAVSAATSTTSPSCLIFTPGHVQTLPVDSATTSAAESLSAMPTTATTPYKGPSM